MAGIILDTPEVKEAFCYYSVGSVLENQFFKHGWFANANGYLRAIGVALRTFHILVSDSLADYDQKGTLNIYKGQALTQESRVLLDMYEMLMFGNFTSDANEATSEQLKQNLRMRMKSIETILYGYNPELYKLGPNLHKAFRRLGIQEGGTLEETVSREFPDYDREPESSCKFEFKTYCRLALVLVLESFSSFVKHDRFVDENLNAGIRWAEDILLDSFINISPWNLQRGYKKRGCFDFAYGELHGIVFDALCDAFEMLLFGDVSKEQNRAELLSEHQQDLVSYVYNSIIRYYKKMMPVSEFEDYADRYAALMNERGLINRFEASSEERERYTQRLADDFCKVHFKNNIFNKYLGNYKDDVKKIFDRAYYSHLFDFESAYRDFKKDNKDFTAIERVSGALDCMASLHPYTEDGSIHIYHNTKNFKKIFRPSYLWKVEAIEQGSSVYFWDYEIKRLIEIGANDVVDYLIRKAVSSGNILACYELNKSQKIEDRLAGTKIWYCIKFLKCFESSGNGLDDAQSYANYVKHNCSEAEKQTVVNKALDLGSEAEKTNVREFLLGDAIEFKHTKKSVSKPQKFAPKKQGCYIATCVYGSYQDPNVCALRRYRDTYLANRIYGRLFIKIYYASSPIMVKVFGKNKVFVSFFKWLLDKKVEKLKKRDYSFDKYKDI